MAVPCWVSSGGIKVPGLRQDWGAAGRQAGITDGAARALYSSRKP